MTQKTLIGFTQENIQTLNKIANEIQTKYGLPMLQALEKGISFNVIEESKPQAPIAEEKLEETESK